VSVDDDDENVALRTPRVDFDGERFVAGNDPMTRIDLSQPTGSALRHLGRPRWRGCALRRSDRMSAKNGMRTTAAGSAGFSPIPEQGSSLA
jgi:hypothetical protein